MDSLPLLSYSHLLVTPIPVPLLPVGEGVGGPQLDKVDSLNEESWASGDEDQKLPRATGEDPKLGLCTLPLFPLAIARCNNGLVEGEKEAPAEYVLLERLLADAGDGLVLNGLAGRDTERRYLGGVT